MPLTQVSNAPLVPPVGAEASATGSADDLVSANRIRCRYELASVDLANPTSGGPRDDWYRYVLASGAARIVGYRRGTLEEVTDFARSSAEEFNLRNSVGWKAASGGQRKQGRFPSVVPKTA